MSFLLHSLFGIVFCSLSFAEFLRMAAIVWRENEMSVPLRPRHEQQQHKVRCGHAVWKSIARSLVVQCAELQVATPSRHIFVIFRNNDNIYIAYNRADDVIIKFIYVYDL